MLPARNRMTRSTDFGVTVSRGVRAAQPDLVLHALDAGVASDLLGAVPSDSPGAPRVGLIVGKSVGNAVVRHRVSRQLRHACRDLLADLHDGERIVIRALPKSGAAPTTRLQAELRDALAEIRMKSPNTGSRR
ncbi:ribonuclease P protein component [Mycobacterium sp. OTB74]|uniref:ribonuclease P protein component n=1 Tax=Mycobacterium sp. OTB74 TaxID=1853452 RepID=UPI002475A478|nr:ribonuclease P protein component [Mycobacterium sp. OTB74]